MFGKNKIINDDVTDALVRDDTAPAEETAESVGCENCARLNEEMEKFKIGWQRALADYQNLQKETVARRVEWARMSEQQIIEEFIPVYENLKMSLDSSNCENENNPWLNGVKLVLKQFADILKSHDVEEIQAVGKKFDPKFHEAIGEEKVEKKKSGEIIKVINGGYIMGDKVIKAAKVIVAK